MPLFIFGCHWLENGLAELDDRKTKKGWANWQNPVPAAIITQNYVLIKFCLESAPEEPKGLGKPCQSLQGAAKGRIIEVQLKNDKV